VTDVGKNLTTGVTTPLVGLGVAALNTAAGFESSMNDVRAVTGATGQDFDRLSDLAREMGSTTQFSASESAEAMTYLGMAGLETDEILSALPGTLALAAAGGMELADAADVSTNVLAGMNMEVEELGHLNDVLADASRSANTDVQQLGMGMKQVAPVASGLGFELEETTAALGFLADAGIQGEQGGTLLRSAMSQLINPTKQAGEMLDQLGVQATEADGSARPLADIMRDFEAAGADASDMTQIFGTEAGPAMISLLNRGGDELEEFETQLQNSAGTAEEMADIKMEL
jgi:TP901 family phage tail tape measure protein